MKICYCEKCGALMRGKAEHPICADCKAGKKPKYRGPRDSAMIPRKKIDALRASDEKKSRK